MKKIFFVFTLLLLSTFARAAEKDSVFQCRIANAENNVYLVLNLYKKNVTVPGADFLGEMAGYFGDNLDFRKWFVTDAEIKDLTHATLYMSNDMGSEDLEASLSYSPQTKEYTLRHEHGSALRIVRNRKWKKLSGDLIFK